MDTKETPKPSPHIEGKFKVVGVLPGIVVTKKFGDVDLRTVSLETAEALHKDKFPYLQKIEKQAEKAVEKKS